MTMRRHIHSIYDTDLHFIIDPVTRQIESESGKVILMQNDHNSERFTFEIPRYVEGHDMSLCNVVEVHYINIDAKDKELKNEAVYPSVDLQISPDDDDMVICSWLISQNCTRYVGSLNFLVRFACVNDSAAIEYQWFTDIYTKIKVSEGIYNTNVETQDNDQDVLAAWKQEVLDNTQVLINSYESHLNELVQEANNQAISSADSAKASSNSAIESSNYATDSANSAIESSNYATDSANSAVASANSAASAKQSEESAEASAALAREIADNIEADTKQSEETATYKAEESANSAMLSKSYAIGGTGIREGEDTDNSKFYTEQAASIVEESRTLLSEADKTLADVAFRTEATIFTPNFETGQIEYVSPNYTFEIDEKTGNLRWETDDNSLEAAINKVMPDSLDAQFEEMHREVDSIRSSVSGFQNGINTAQSTADTAQSGVNALNTRMSSAEQSISDLEAELEGKIDTEGERFTASISEIRSLANTAQSTADTASSNASTALSNISALTVRMDTNESAITSAQDGVNDLDDRLTALANCDDETLDQLSEIVAYIKANRDLIDGVTTSKVSVSDIIDLLTSTATNKPLSANQGKVLKGLIDSHTHSNYANSSVLSSQDLNTVRTPGFYNAGGGNTVTNKPSGVEHFGLMVVKRASGEYYAQLLFDNNGKSHRRFCNNDVWGDWTTDKLTDTTYSAATTSTAGLMSAADKTKSDATNVAYGTCSTTAATAEKVVTISGNTNWKLAAGSVIVVKFSATNTAQNPKLNVNGTGAKSIWFNTELITTSNLGYAGTANRPIEFMYDGTQYVFIGWAADSNTTYSQATLGQGYGTCTTAADTVAKVVSLSSYALATGGIVSVKFSYAVPASATMNINSKGAKAIYYKGAAITAGIINAGDVATFIYNGSQYHLISIDNVVAANTDTLVQTLIARVEAAEAKVAALEATINSMTFTVNTTTGNLEVEMI